MMIDKTELLRMIMENNPGQSPAFILDQYTVYVKGLNNISGENFLAQTLDNENQELTLENNVDEKQVKPSLTCGYTKRKLKVKPEDAIQRDVIICCICGREGKTLTERHLSTHNGLTREGYLKLCGYDAKQPLMSERHLARMKNNVMKAQEARKAKRNRDSD